MGITLTPKVVESCSNPQKTRQVFKSAMKKKIWFCFFCEWCHKWSTFRPLGPISSGSGPKLLYGSISLIGN